MYTARIMADEPEELPELTEDEISHFIDLWESSPCLWNPGHKDYKHKGKKSKALENFSSKFLKGWTPAMISRKIESLKSSFRKERARRSGATGTPRGKKREWHLYDRIYGFYGMVLYAGRTVLGSECPLAPSDLSRGEEHLEPGTNSSGGDIEMLQQQIKSRTSSESSADSQEPVSWHPDPSWTRARRVLRKRSRTEHFPEAQEASDFHGAVTDILHQMQESRKCQEYHFAMAIASDMAKIQSQKRLINLKKQIYDLVHKALTEEMPEDA